MCFSVIISNFHFFNSKLIHPMRTVLNLVKRNKRFISNEKFEKVCKTVDTVFKQKETFEEKIPEIAKDFDLEEKINFYLLYGYQLTKNGFRETSLPHINNVLSILKESELTEKENYQNFTLSLLNVDKDLDITIKSAALCLQATEEFKLKEIVYSFIYSIVYQTCEILNDPKLDKLERLEICEKIVRILEETNSEVLLFEHLYSIYAQIMSENNLEFSMIEKTYNQARDISIKRKNIAFSHEILNNLLIQSYQNKQSDKIDYYISLLQKEKLDEKNQFIFETTMVYIHFYNKNFVKSNELLMIILSKMVGVEFVDQTEFILLRIQNLMFMKKFTEAREIYETLKILNNDYLSGKNYIDIYMLDLLEKFQDFKEIYLSLEEAFFKISFFEFNQSIKLLYEVELSLPNSLEKLKIQYLIARLCFTMKNIILAEKVGLNAIEYIESKEFQMPSKMEDKKLIEFIYINTSNILIKNDRKEQGIKVLEDYEKRMDPESTDYVQFVYDMATLFGQNRILDKSIEKFHICLNKSKDPAIKVNSLMSIGSFAGILQQEHEHYYKLALKIAKENNLTELEEKITNFLANKILQ